jgi:hypothetical protein
MRHQSLVSSLAVSSLLVSKSPRHQSLNHPVKGAFLVAPATRFLHKLRLSRAKGKQPMHSPTRAGDSSPAQAFIKSGGISCDFVRTPYVQRRTLSRHVPTLRIPQALLGAMHMHARALRCSNSWQTLASASERHNRNLSHSALTARSPRAVRPQPAPLPKEAS